MILNEFIKSYDLILIGYPFNISAKKIKNLLHEYIDIKIIESLSRLNLKKISSKKKICLFTLFDISEEIFELIKQLIPNTALLFATFSDFNSKLYLNDVITTMKPFQTINYLEAKIQTEDCDKFTNIYFEKPINTLNDLWECSPKFKELMKLVLMNRTQTHYIYTKYQDNYGIHTLKIMFKNFENVVISNEPCAESVNNLHILDSFENLEQIAHATNVYFYLSETCTGKLCVGRDETNLLRKKYLFYENAKNLFKSIIYENNQLIISFH